MLIDAITFRNQVFNRTDFICMDEYFSFAWRENNAYCAEEKKRKEIFIHCLAATSAVAAAISVARSKRNK